MNNENTIIATVNGEEISRFELDVQTAQLVQNPKIQTPDPENKEQYAQFERAVAEQLVNDALIYADAKEQGFTTTDEAVEKEFGELAQKFETAEDFAKQLAALSLTEESLKENIRRQHIVDQYYKQIFDKHDIAIGEDEARTLYDQHIANQENAPAFEEIKDQIELELKQQKMQAVLAEIIQKLREPAKIEITLS